MKNQKVVDHKPIGAHENELTNKSRELDIRTPRYVEQLYLGTDYQRPETSSEKIRTGWDDASD